MGLDETVETITGILLVMGALPFLMARLERSLDYRPTPPVTGTGPWSRPSTGSPPGGVGSRTAADPRLFRNG